MLVTFLLISSLISIHCQFLPEPFIRVLKPSKFPYPNGTDVYILQNLLKIRYNIAITSAYDDQTVQFLNQFKSSIGLPADSIFDEATATAILLPPKLGGLGYDGYKDDGQAPSVLGYMYKLHVKFYWNRSIETIADFISTNGTILKSYPVRGKGHEVGNFPQNFPYWNSSGIGLNEFSSDGATPTGLAEFDLNSPESDPIAFGPFPVNRVVRGLKGNVAWTVTNVASTTIRDGILHHTGQWFQYIYPGTGKNWTPGDLMPNSLGCLHAYPENIYFVWQTLVNDLNVQVRPNTNGALPYPYKPQGLISVECMDC
jgi:Putative peptidoglycan binding domain